LPALQALGNGKTLFVSIAAGTTIATFEAALGADTPIVRTMPNTPAMVGRGITALVGNGHVSPSDLALAKSLMAAVGQVVELTSEDQIDAVTAVSGSGPAYVFYFVEAMMQAAQQMGLSAEQGKQLALSTFAGATALAQASSEPPDVLRERVTSKGGTTYAALTSMEASGVKAAFVKAIAAAQQRAKELGNEFG